MPCIDIADLDLDIRLDRESWTEYDFQRPPDVLCKFWNSNTYRTFIAKPSDFSPEFNVAGLYWKLTGIGREQLTGHAQDQQFFRQNWMAWERMCCAASIARTAGTAGMCNEASPLAGLRGKGQ